MAERKERRRRSLKSLIAAAQKAGLPISKINPDGSVEIGETTCRRKR